MCPLSGRWIIGQINLAESQNWTNSVVNTYYEHTNLAESYDRTKLADDFYDLTNLTNDFYKWTNLVDDDHSQITSAYKDMNSISII